MRLLRHAFPESSPAANRLLIDAHYEIMRTNIAASPIIGVLAASVLLGRTPTVRLVSASLIIIALSALLFAFGVPLAAEGSNEQRQKVFLVMNGIAGIVWGGYFAAILPPDAGSQSWLAIAVPLAMVANMVEAAPVAHSFLGFHVPFTAATATTWAVFGVGTNRWAAALFVVLGVYVTILARATHKEAHQRAELTVRNEALVADLERANSNLERMNADLRRDSHHDRLTGVPNRRALDRFLSDAFLERSVIDARTDAIVLRDEIVALFVDLDGFKAVNDTHGHHVGDEVLTITARRLESCLPRDGFLARYGGDEFVVVLAGCSSLAPSLDLADRIVAAIAEPYTIDGLTPIAIGASVGVSISSDDCRTARELLHEADTGLYRAKQAGRSRWMTAC